MKGLIEILTNKQWMIAPDKVHAIRKVLEQNLNGHIAFTPQSKKMGYPASQDGSPFEEYLITEDGQTYSSWFASKVKYPFVNVIMVDGPITRNGGACSYGSIEHRDMMIDAANNKNCRGHVFLIDTPGGSAWAKNDYQQAIEYARSKGQPVYAFIDGICASAGMYLAALCDKRFYMHPKNEIGSIGVLAAFYTEKDGEKNKYTNETYHELYDPESFDKNKWYRDIVNEGNDKELIDELIALGKEFRADVKKRCTNATDEHLHGKLFNAEDVKGILVDEQSTLGDVVGLCFDTYEQNHQSSNSDYEMKEQYQIVAAVCGVDELVITEEGTHLDLSLVDKLTEKLNADKSAIADANQQVTDLKAAHEKALADLKAQHDQAIADLKAEGDKAIADQKEANDKALADAQTAHEEAMKGVTEAKEQAEKDLAGAKNALATAEQTIADRDEKIKALTSKPADTPDESPANNGTGAEKSTIGTMPAYDDSKSPEENARIRKEWKAKNGQ